MPATGATISDLVRVHSRAHPPCSDRRCAGRPPVLEGGERRELILNAACQILDDHGYHSASMDKLAHMSGMSKKTIYQMFASKEDLFRTLISERLFDIKRMAVHCPAGITPEAELVHILVTIATRVLAPERMCLVRAIVGEIRDSAEIRRIMQSIELCGNSNQIEEWLLRQQAAGTWPIDDVEDLAIGLFNMTVGKLILGELFHARALVSLSEIEANIRRWVRIFLAGLSAIEPGRS
ncbi:TetR/AcrR family transcriptional regulator [Gluconacetobacter sacchari]|uniref:TetR/AcrR family transcriptional regulator n=2 Tax=Gluconacetobacter sacchari TaxID=92759 RepID=A0A7W4IC11_9PROT|nr:TetR/AcrR family transcriptional regulator [Gluconacetobacter sacchari]MBB2160037.1 TetR/AcrR family transcriptional regulator [Gluconacetobacter sacchari]GBQ25625.1 putative transcriptional regulator [Gluconacetobacter sacchari DSM 12717]